LASYPGFNEKPANRQSSIHCTLSNVAALPVTVTGHALMDPAVNYGIVARRCLIRSGLFFARGMRFPHYKNLSRVETNSILNGGTADREYAIAEAHDSHIKL
jgi:hypothetical protein